jgi:hypothetical protein
LDLPDIKGYFYLDGETKEVANSLKFIYDPDIWRGFNFSDWDSIER